MMNPWRDLPGVSESAVSCRGTAHMTDSRIRDAQLRVELLPARVPIATAVFVKPPRRQHDGGLRQMGVASSGRLISRFNRRSRMRRGSDGPVPPGDGGTDRGGLEWDSSD